MIAQKRKNEDTRTPTSPIAQVRGPATLLVLLVLLILVILSAVGYGAVSIQPGQTLSIVLDEIGLANTIAAYEPLQQTIVVNIRLPRVVLGALIGAALGAAGAALQGLFRNPLADPSLIGISSGGALLATVVLWLTGPNDPLGIAQTVTDQRPGIDVLFATLGAAGAMLLIYRLATRAGRTDVVTMLLAGVALNALAGAGIGVLALAAGGAAGVADVQFFTTGGLNRANWQNVQAALPFLGFTLVAFPFTARPLNALLLGDAEARHLGVDTGRIKLIVVVLVAIAVGAGVAVAGVIGFIALITPHLVRLVTGPDHRYVIPGAALLGASLTLIADTVARTMAAPAEINLSFITATVGAPFFLWLLLRDRNRRG